LEGYEVAKNQSDKRSSGSHSLIAVVCSGQMVLGTAVFFVSMLAMYEYFRSLTNAGYRPVKAVGYISCAAVLFLSWSEVLKNSFFQQIISLKSLLLLSLP